MLQLIFTSKTNKKVGFITNYNEAFDFIVKNHDSKIRTIDYNAKTKVYEKRKFLTEFYKSVDDKNKFFQVAELMVKGVTNLNEFLTLLGVREDYKAYKKHNSKVI